MNKITIVLMITLFYLNVADSCTTLILLSRTGMIETNPIMAFMFINGLMTAIIFKVSIVGTMLIAFYYILTNINENHEQQTAKTITIIANIALLCFTVFLMITVINNMTLIMR